MEEKASEIRNTLGDEVNYIYIKKRKYNFGMM